MRNKEGRQPGSSALLAVAGAYLGWRALRGRGQTLTGKVALITGGSRGLGFLLAQELAAEGCRIVICARDPIQLQEAEERLLASGAEVLSVVCDVSDRADVEALVAQATDVFGRIDILINNAGIIQVGPIDSMRLDDFERAMDVMYWGPVYTTMAVMPQMVDRGEGRIVNVTSIGGKVSVPHLLPYNAAKFALVGLSEGLRAELRRHGVFVTTIVPGLMRTGSPVNAMFKGDAEKEFTWFSLSSATPLTTMSARRAAKRIVEATRRREAEVTLTWQASLLRLAHGIAPGSISEILGMVNYVLPRGSNPEERRGMELATPLAPSAATGMMNRAARRNNEFGGIPQPATDHAEQIGL